MIEDYPSTSVTTETRRTNKFLNYLEALLLQHGKHIIEYDLPISTGEYDNDLAIPRLIQDELTVPNVDEELTLIEKLNNYQRVAYETIMTVIYRKKSMTFFVNGPGGIGKIFLYCTILATLRKVGHIAIVTSTSGIVATLLPGGRAVHSRFKIPLTPDASSTCSIIVPKGTKAEMIDACTVKSPLWKDVKVLHLKQNMRFVNDEEFAKYIQCIGDGNEPFIVDDLIKLPPSMAMQ
ncbi:uncharacterized protein LOC115964595 [Quercus lobata]|uniref:uncharacterized protein LOC115964595 n=1 Tax=Quercus lobata TaxID=97700 RepID=UPI001244A410|nr:uncharacterized protein LOC115964595 [Quercus lobata]